MFSFVSLCHSSSPPPRPIFIFIFTLSSVTIFLSHFQPQSIFLSLHTTLAFSLHSVCLITVCAQQLTSFQHLLIHLLSVLVLIYRLSPHLHMHSFSLCLYLTVTLCLQKKHLADDFCSVVAYSTSLTQNN